MVDLKSLQSRQVFSVLDPKLMIADITKNEAAILFHSALSVKKQIAILSMTYFQ